MIFTDVLQRRFHKAMIEAFGDELGAYDASSWLSHLGDARQVDDLFDELEFEFSGDIEERERDTFQTVGDAMEWAQERVEAEAAEEASQGPEPDEVPMAFAWRDEISLFQKAILKISGVVGVLMFFLGMQLVVRGNKELGGTLTAAGMFLSTQMFWGIMKCYNWLEKKHLGFLRKIGYKSFFWIFLIGTYTVEVIGLAAVFKLLGLELPAMPK